MKYIDNCNYHIDVLGKHMDKAQKHRYGDKKTYRMYMFLILCICTNKTCRLIQRSYISR